MVSDDLELTLCHTQTDESARSQSRLKELPDQFGDTLPKWE